MNDEITIYTVQPDETLISIAQRYEMTEPELRDFHNQHCHKVGLLWFSGFVGIQKIVVPNNYKSPSETAREYKHTLPPAELTAGFYGRQYSVIESYESNIEDTLHVDYTLNILLEADKSEADVQWVASVQCFGFLKEGAKPDDKMSEISLACSEAIGAMPFVLNKNGQMVQIAQFAALSEKFKQRRAELEDFFVGEIFSKYLDKFEDCLLDQVYFEKQLFSTLLYQVLFFGASAFHRSSSWQQPFHLVKNSFPLLCRFKRTVELLNDQEVQTVFSGESTEEVSLQSLLTGRRTEEVPGEVLSGFIELKYTTHRTTKQLLAAKAELSLFDGEELYRKQKIKLTKM